MAVTNPSDVATAIEVLWARLTLRLHTYDSFWDRFVSQESHGGCLIRRTDLLNKPGDTIWIQTTDPLSGGGISGDTATLIGNEEKLATASFSVVPLLYRHAVLVNRRANKKSIVDLREEAHFRLGEWGRDKMDAIRFANFLSTGSTINGIAYNANRKWAAGRTADNTVTASDKLSVDEIRKLRVKLMQNKAKPFMHHGLPVYFGVISPGMAYDLKSDSTYNTAVQNALPRMESENPIFSGALAMVDGVVLFESFNLPVVTNLGAGANVPGVHSIFFGQEAFVEGIDEDVSWFEDDFDYGLQHGTSYSFAFQPRRGREYNSIRFTSAQTVV